MKNISKIEYYTVFLYNNIKYVNYLNNMKILNFISFILVLFRIFSRINPNNIWHHIIKFNIAQYFQKFKILKALSLISLEYLQE
jgi:hypothetical protein